MLNLIIYIVIYASGFIFSGLDIPFVSGILFIGMAMYLYMADYFRVGSLFNLRGLFVLSFLGGQGLSLLQLSYLQKDWKLVTWIAFFLAFVLFYAVYEYMSVEYGKVDMQSKKRNHRGFHPNRLLFCITLLTCISVAAFLFEAVILGFVPLFVRGVPHAYSAFHISGVHYFTVSCVLVPALGVLYLHDKERGAWQRLYVIALGIVAITIPILCVSRFQLMFAILLATITFILLQGRSRGKWFLFAIFAIVPIYALLTIARSHDSAYLSSIFEMKYNIPSYIGQPYIYIANNYDNFNQMVEELPRFTWGQKMLFPVFALSGMKFVFPSLVDLPIFVTKKELTTLTLFYDAYYDFGLIGVGVFSALLGFVSYLIERNLSRMRNRISILFYAQLCLYVSFSFFTTWFTNPTTWFYFVVTTMIYFFCNNKKKSEVFY